jgi:hypothetical protein
MLLLVVDQSVVAVGPVLVPDRARDLRKNGDLLVVVASVFGPGDAGIRQERRLAGAIEQKLRGDLDHLAVSRPDVDAAHRAAFVRDRSHCLARNQLRTAFHGSVEHQLVEILPAHLPGRLREELPVLVPTHDWNEPGVPPARAVDGEPTLHRKPSREHLLLQSEQADHGAALARHLFPDMVAGERLPFDDHGLNSLPRQVHRTGGAGGATADDRNGCLQGRHGQAPLARLRLRCWVPRAALPCRNGSFRARLCDSAGFYHCSVEPERSASARANFVRTSRCG